MRRRGLPLGHELRGSLPVLGPRAEKPLAAPGGGLHAAGFQAARNHAPDGGEALHLHRQLHHASAAPGNHSPYLKEPSSPSPALISCTLLLGTIPAPGAPPPLVFFPPVSPPSSLFPNQPPHPLARVDLGLLVEPFPSGQSCAGQDCHLRCHLHAPESVP